MKGAWGRSASYAGPFYRNLPHLCHVFRACLEQPCAKKKAGTEVHGRVQGVPGEGATRHPQDGMPSKRFQFKMENIFPESRPFWIEHDWEEGYVQMTAA
jgi:hypothetical protein